MKTWHLYVTAMFCHRPINIKSVITPWRGRVNRYTSTPLIPKACAKANHRQRQADGVRSVPSKRSSIILSSSAAQAARKARNRAHSWWPATVLKHAWNQPGHTRKAELGLKVAFGYRNTSSPSLRALLFGNPQPRAGPHPSARQGWGRVVPSHVSVTLLFSSLPVGPLHLPLYSVSVTSNQDRH